MADADAPLRIAVDLDGTICAIKHPGESYADIEPNSIVTTRAPKTTMTELTKKVPIPAVAHALT